MQSFLFISYVMSEKLLHGIVRLVVYRRNRIQPDDHMFIASSLNIVHYLTSIHINFCFNFYYDPPFHRQFNSRLSC